MTRRYYYCAENNEYWTDLAPGASELWVVAGPAPYHVRDEVHDYAPMPRGYRYVTDEEWEELSATLTTLDEVTQ